MRKQLSDALLLRAPSPNMVFLTGDLGFMALEELQAAMGQRFINAGVAEQNMISVAAAMSKQGMEAWVYSIAPFCYARPFEQIRNDVCFHGLPVKIIGNGGGYGYGVMGPTHHAIEDYGVLLTLPSMTVYVPAFDQDLEALIPKMAQENAPGYLRLGRGEVPASFTVPQYAPWRQITSGNGPTVIAMGPLAGLYIEAFSLMAQADRPNFWIVTELPFAKNPIPEKLLDQIAKSSGLLVVEEHVAHGGLASSIALDLLQRHMSPKKFTNLHAQKHIYESYGSQGFLRDKSGLSLPHILQALKTLSA